MTVTQERLLPNVDDPVAALFWAAAREMRFILQACAECGRVRWPPAPICPGCLGAAHEWEEFAGGGTIWSIAVYHRALHPSFTDSIPYAVVLVDLDAGPKMLSRLVSSAEPTYPGQRVRPSYEAVSSKVTLVNFELAEDA